MTRQRKSFFSFALVLTLILGAASYIQAARAWPPAPTGNVPSLNAYPGGVVGPEFVTIRDYTGAPNLQALDCYGTGNPEVFVHSSPTVFDFLAACPGRGVQIVRIRFESPTDTQWTAVDPSGMPIGLPITFPPGLHTAYWNAPSQCVGHITLLGIGGAEDGAKEVCIRRINYRCKPRITITLPGLASLDPVGEPSWSLQVPVGKQSVNVEAELQLDADLEPFAKDEDEENKVNKSNRDDTKDKENFAFSGAPTNPPPATGVGGWTVAVEVSGNFEIDEATVVSTFGESAISGGFVHLEVVDPSRNAGRRGVVGVVAMPVQEGGHLPARDAVILRIKGRMDASAVRQPGSVSQTARFTPLTRPEDALVGSGLPVVSSLSTDFTEMVSTGNGSISLVGMDRQILRGDANDDSRHDLSDIIYLAEALYFGTQEISCTAAADTDGNGAVEMNDLIRGLEPLYLGNRPPPPPPYPSCGPVQLPDPSDCERYSSCGDTNFE